MRHVLLATTVLITLACQSSGTALPPPGKCTNPPPRAPDACQLAAGPSLPVARNAANMVAVRGHLYLFGGQAEGSNRYATTVLTATPGPDGSFDAWTPTTPLPLPLGAMGVATTDDAIYLFGGHESDGWTDVARVWRAAVKEDGTLAPWQELAPLPRPVHQTAAVIVGNRAYVLGGMFEGADDPNTSKDDLKMVYVGELAPDGTLGAWSETKPLPEFRFLHGAFTANGVIYVLGGRTRLPTEICGTHHVVAAKPDAAGAILAWYDATALPLPMHGFAVAVSGDHVFVAGGVAESGEEQDDVLSAKLLPTGALEPWKVVGRLPVARYALAGAAAGDRLYFAGGLVEAQFKLSEVRTARVGADGRLECSP